ncbi:MAG TPA: alpha-amylase family glycosyl hydrolase [Williamwhitmania sp.]|nr:alpha-amylase family glycosyl hydrolase [Williamwhitmania sp.]
MRSMLKRLRSSYTGLGFAILLATFVLFSSCNNTGNNQPAQKFQVAHPEWSYNATIYEVNLRQYTPSGTLTEFKSHIPELKKLGVKIIWFMPIYPIGEVNRKGSLGSYYSVKDYMKVNPEFGTMEEFKDVVKILHENGMKVILDWVANHTSQDNALITEHPDWYKHDSTGKIVSPFDWTDVAQLDYSKPELQKYMIGAMKYWLTEADVDGFRCDVAGMVPTPFWNKARAEFDKVKPVFMLAEAEQPDLQEYAFDMTYSWEFHHIMNAIAQGKDSIPQLDSCFQKELVTYPKNAFRMRFITNHDENSWNGSEFERMGDAVKAMAALTFVVPGMPLIYSGQEVGMHKRLRFFDKDTINWPNNEWFPFYQKLVELKATNPALLCGEKGADMFRIKSANSKIYAFTRENEQGKVLAIFNFSKNKQSFTLDNEALAGHYVDLFADKATEIDIPAKADFTLGPWGFLIYVKK